MKMKDIFGFTQIPWLAGSALAKNKAQKSCSSWKTGEQIHSILLSGCFPGFKDLQTKVGCGKQKSSIWTTLLCACLDKGKPQSVASRICQCLLLDPSLGPL